VDDLRLERGSAKWAVHPPDVLPAWVAEMDFPLAEPVKAVLHAAIERDDAGYLGPTSAGWLRRSPASPRRRCCSPTRTTRSGACRAAGA
jgi:hypothetical protein